MCAKADQYCLIEHNFAKSVLEAHFFKQHFLAFMFSEDRNLGIANFCHYGLLDIFFILGDLVRLGSLELGFPVMNRPH